MASVVSKEQSLVASLQESLGSVDFIDGVDSFEAVDIGEPLDSYDLGVVKKAKKLVEESAAMPVTEMQSAAKKYIYDASPDLLSTANKYITSAQDVVRAGKSQLIDSTASKLLGEGVDSISLAFGVLPAGGLVSRVALGLGASIVKNIFFGRSTPSWTPPSKSWDYIKPTKYDAVTVEYAVDHVRKNKLQGKIAKATGVDKEDVDFWLNAIYTDIQKKGAKGLNKYTIGSNRKQGVGILQAPANKGGASWFDLSAGEISERPRYDQTAFITVKGERWSSSHPGYYNVPNLKRKGSGYTWEGSAIISHGQNAALLHAILIYYANSLHQMWVVDEDDNVDKPFVRMVAYGDLGKPIRYANTKLRSDPMGNTWKGMLRFVLMWEEVFSGKDSKGRLVPFKIKKKQDIEREVKKRGGSGVCKVNALGRLYRLKPQFVYRAGGKSSKAWAKATFLEQYGVSQAPGKYATIRLDPNKTVTEAEKKDPKKLITPRKPPKQPPPPKPGKKADPIIEKEPEATLPEQVVEKDPKDPSGETLKVETATSVEVGGADIKKYWPIALVAAAGIYLVARKK